LPGISIRGETGLCGTQGVTGVDVGPNYIGATGLQGPIGLQGATGVGPRGATGVGIQGATGIFPSGASGSFITSDNKTVTVLNGIIISIV
jgi:hypothetical protein